MSFTGKPETFLNSTIANDGFFPNLSLGDFQVFYRLPVEFKQEVVEHHLRLAMVDCNAKLEDKKNEWVLLGACELAQADGREIGGKNILVEQYQRAVFCHAKATMLREFATVNRRQEAENLGKESAETHDDYFAQAKRAVRTLLGIKETITVELI